MDVNNSTEEIITLDRILEVGESWNVSRELEEEDLHKDSNYQRQMCGYIEIKTFYSSLDSAWNKRFILH